VPGALGEQRVAVGIDMAIADGIDVGQGAGRGDVPDVRLGAVIGEGLVVQVLLEVVRAEHIVEDATGGRRQADFLGILLVAYRHPSAVEHRHIEAVVITRGEVPPAVGADRSQGEVVGQGPVGLDRGTALEHRHLLVGIEVDLAVLARYQCSPSLGGQAFVAVDAIDGRPGAVEAEDAVVGILFVVFTDPAQVEGFARLEQQLGTKALAFATVELVAVVDVLHITIVFGVVGTDAPGQRLGDRPGVTALGLQVAVLANRLLNAALGVEGRFARGDVQHPRRGVLAEQRTLRAAQHFQLVDIEQVEHRHARPPEVDVVQIDADAAFQAIAGRVVAQATNRDARLPRMHIGDIGAGHQLLQILHTVDALGFQGFAAEHTDGRGHALRGFLAAAGIDRDRAELGFLLHGRRGADGFFGKTAVGCCQQHAGGQGLQGKARRARRPTGKSRHTNAP